HKLKIPTDRKTARFLGTKFEHLQFSRAQLQEIHDFLKRKSIVSLTNSATTISRTLVGMSFAAQVAPVVGGFHAETVLPACLDPKIKAML
ncbi:MAG: hypothetical protein RLZZ536_1535, partial [Planctomycetota bacterium]